MKKSFIFILMLHLTWAEHNYTNALSTESSPYLQQHAHNPVNWYPWGKVALQKAKKENKLIFLSIGYSTCHWCHVMEEESFMDADISKLLNDYFVSIKVDREEYPQIDKKYQKLFMAIHGERGGWPLSVFLSPDAEVFHLATYIPKEEGYGSKGLLNLLPSFVALQKQSAAFQKIIQSYKKEQSHSALKAQLDTKIIEKVVDEIAKQYDTRHGGFSTRPKFPEASKIALLLDIYKLSGNKQAYVMAKTTLKKMAQGGIYDQIRGGFFRYTTDDAWQIPHFEKMLYTNAELVPVYVEMYRMSKDTLYKRVVDETIAQMEEHYIQKNKHNDGLYLSASDADSDGEEGRYFIYDYLVVKEALKAKNWSSNEIEKTLAYLGIEEDGNIDGELSHTHITAEVAPKRLEELRTYLRNQSAKRTFPFVDKKINTAWNAMMIKALFEASKIEKRYLLLAEKRLNGLLKLMRKEGVLYHQVILGDIPKQKGLLEDYAFLIAALMSAYERTYKDAYLSLAQTLSKESIRLFYRQKEWYLSNDGIKAKADFDDRYYTAALSVMLENLVRLASLTNDLTYSGVVQETIKEYGGVLEHNPSFAPKLVHTFLRLRLGDIIVHAKREKLLLAQTALDSMKYPFVLSATQESDEYLACKTTMCFANDTNISKLIEKINKVVE